MGEPISRRHFIGRTVPALVATPLILASSSANIPTPETSVGARADLEVEGNLSPAEQLQDLVLFIDNNSLGEVELRRILGQEFTHDDYLILEEFSIQQLGTEPTDKAFSLYEETQKKYKYIKIGMAILNEWRGHAVMTTKAFSSAVCGTLEAGSVRLNTLGDVLEPIKFADTRTGIMAISHLSAQRIGDSIESNDRNRGQKGPVKLINMSLQVGTSKFFVDYRKGAIAPILESMALNRVVVQGQDYKPRIDYYAPVGYHLKSIEDNGTERIIVVDDDGNPTEIEPIHEDDVDDYYKQYSYDHLEPSDVGHQMVEPYSPLMGDGQSSNLLELISLCERFPDKVFSVAAGNENSDFGDLKSQFIAAGKWPENLIVHGFINKVDGVENNIVTSRGADLYLEKFTSTSETSAYMSGIIGMMMVLHPEWDASRVVQEFRNMGSVANLDRYRMLSPSFNTTNIHAKDGDIVMANDPNSFVNFEGQIADTDRLEKVQREFLALHINDLEQDRNPVIKREGNITTIETLEGTYILERHEGGRDFAHLDELGITGICTGDEYQNNHLTPRSRGELQTFSEYLKVPFFDLRVDIDGLATLILNSGIPAVEFILATSIVNNILYGHGNMEGKTEDPSPNRRSFIIRGLFNLLGMTYLSSPAFLSSITNKVSRLSLVDRAKTNTFSAVTKIHPETMLAQRIHDLLIAQKMYYIQKQSETKGRRSLYLPVGRMSTDLESYIMMSEADRLDLIRKLKLLIEQIAPSSSLYSILRQDSDPIDDSGETNIVEPNLFSIFKQLPDNLNNPDKIS